MQRVVLSIGLVGAAAVVVGVMGRGAAPQDPGRGPDAEVVRVARRDLGSVVTATGVVKPMSGAQVRVGSRISGVVTRLFVRIGDAVQKGQPLAELDAREPMARRAQAAAALELAKANRDYARTDLRRKRELGASRLISSNDLELAERACAVAEQQLREAEANFETAGVQLDYTRIQAPIGGVVASVSTQEGETVAASFAAPTFVTLLDLRRLEVWAYVDETDIGRIQAGQKARFTVDTYPDHEFEGQVTAVYPQAEIRDNVVNYVSVVKFEPPRDRILRPEMTATVKIALEARENVLTVPRRALRREGGRQFVLCRKGDSVERRWVTTGSKDESGWEILEGLSEGDEVLVGELQPQ